MTRSERIEVLARLAVHSGANVAEHVKRSRLLHAPEDSLAFTPAWWDRHIEECIERRSAYIVVWGDPQPELLSDLDPARR